MLRRALARIFSFPVMLASVVSFWVFVGAGYSVWDADIWWHLRNAEYLLAHHATPRVDIFSYTTNGHAWMNHEWLSEIPFFLAWRAGGLMGIYLTFVLLLVIIMLGIFYYAARESGNVKAAFVVTCFSLFLTVVSFGPRTILFGYILLLVLLLILSRFRNTGDAPLWVLPPLFCVWINTHGSWLLGMILLGIYIVSGLVEGSWGRIDAVRWTPQQLRRLLMATGASIAALFVNPFTYKLVFYPFNLAFVQKLNIAYVDEWASVDFNDARGKVVFILLAGIILGALFSRYRWKLHEFLLTGFALYAGLKHIRFLFLAAILLAPLLSKLLDEIVPPYRKEIDKPALNAAVMAILLTIGIYRFPPRADLQSAVDTRFPAKAVAYIQENRLKGNFFHRYMWGGYLIYFCRDTKTFVDGRTDIFEYTGVLKDYLDIEQLKGSLGLLDKYDIRYALVPPDFPIAYLLKNHVGWKVLYQDDVAMIFERDASTVSPSEAVDPAGGSR
jgi:hypothetical protein